MPTTEVILTERVTNLGAEADVVKVKRGYARNFLIPRGKALEVTLAGVCDQRKAPRQGEEQTAESSENTQISETRGTESGTVGGQIAPELSRIVAAWPGLAEPIRQAILALIG